MELAAITKNPVIKKYGLWIVGGLAAVYLAYKYIGSGSSAATSAGTVSSATGLDDAQYAAYVQAQEAATSQQNAAQLANNQLNAQLAATQGEQTVQETAAVGSTLSQVITAQDALPAAIVNAATADSQTALMAAASAASAGLSAVPGSIQASADAIAATEQPWDALAQSEGTSQSAAFNSLATSVSNSTAAAASASGSSARASSAANQSSNSMWSTIGTVATVAALA